MSDEVKGVAVLGDGMLRIMCHPTHGERAGQRFPLAIAAHPMGTPAAKPGPHWQFVITRAAVDGVPGRLDVSPSVKCTVKTWHEDKQAFGDPDVEIFHNSGAWSIDYVELKAGEVGYDKLMEVNP